MSPSASQLSEPLQSEVTQIKERLSINLSDLARLFQSYNLELDSLNASSDWNTEFIRTALLEQIHENLRRQSLVLEQIQTVDKFTKIALDNKTSTVVPPGLTEERLITNVLPPGHFNPSKRAQPSRKQK